MNREKRWWRLIHLRRRLGLTALLALSILLLGFLVPLNWQTRQVESREDMLDLRFGWPVEFIGQNQEAMEPEVFPATVGLDHYKDAPTRIFLGGSLSALACSFLLASVVVGLNERSQHRRKFGPR